MLAVQLGEFPSTYASLELLKDLTGFMPKTSINQGIKVITKFRYII